MQNPIQYAPCPSCGQSNAKKIGYTWWGGALGPSMMTHVKCESCGTQYNGKTGLSNQKNIIIYFLVTLMISFCLLGGLAFLNAFLNNN
jgi:transposase-like protein